MLLNKYAPWIAGALIVWAQTALGAESAVVAKHFRFTYSATNTSSQTISEADIRVPIPQRKTPYQTRVDVSSSLPITATGVDWAEVRVPATPPFGRVDFLLNVSMSFEREAKAEPADKAYLQGERFIEKDDNKIRSTALRLMKGNDTRSTLSNLYRWVRTSLRPLGYTANPRGALQAFQSRQGDCTEYALLLTAMARSIGIPARVAEGYVYRESARIRPTDYHNWVEVQIEGTWFPVDTYEGRFLDRTSDYLVMNYWGSQIMPGFVKLRDWIVRLE